MFRLKGQRAKLTAAEVNKWNKLADQQARGELRQRVPSVSNYDPSSRVALVQNNSGADRQQYECLALDGMLWDITAAGDEGVIFDAGAADSSKPPAILIEPIAKSEIGRAVVDGLALALVNAGSGEYADPDATSSKLEPAASGGIRVLSSVSAADEKLLPVVLNAGTSGGATVDGACITFTWDPVDNSGTVNKWGANRCVRYATGSGGTALDVSLVAHPSISNANLIEFGTAGLYIFHNSILFDTIDFATYAPFDLNLTGAIQDATPSIVSVDQRFLRRIEWPTAGSIHFGEHITTYASITAGQKLYFGVGAAFSFSSVNWPSADGYLSIIRLPT